MANDDQKDTWNVWVSRTSDILSVAKGTASFVALLAIAIILVCKPSQVVPTLKGLLAALRDSGFTRISVTGMEADLTKLNEAVSTANQGAISALRSLETARTRLKAIYSSDDLPPKSKTEVKEALGLVDQALNSLSLSKKDSQGILAQTGIGTAAPEKIKDANQWLVVVGADATVGEAQFELAKVKKSGFDSSRILLRNNLYRTVVPFNDRETAEDGIDKIGAAVKRQVFMVDSRQWCPQVAEASKSGGSAPYISCAPN
jgi:hypothetical protein